MDLSVVSHIQPHTARFLASFGKLFAGFLWPTVLFEKAATMAATGKPEIVARSRPGAARTLFHRRDEGFSVLGRKALTGLTHALQRVGRNVTLTVI